ncbi:MAG: phosphoenolpyruvate carboxykinase (GTP), partial [Christensenellaceae bacterium]|nr:phosphoenolpyruvate carboxykinase (GTP) [Christensenellaceae bacterium]
FGDNMRVLDWIIERCEGNADAVETAIGYEPKAEDINIEGLSDVTVDTVKDLLNVDKDLWKEDVEGIKAFYARFGDRLPEEMAKQLKALEARLDA